MQLPLLSMAQQSFKLLFGNQTTWRREAKDTHYVFIAAGFCGPTANVRRSHITSAINKVVLGTPSPLLVTLILGLPIVSNLPGFSGCAGRLRLELIWAL